MKTEDLIQMLGDDAPNPLPDRGRFWPLAIGLGLIGALILMALTLHPRPDLIQAVQPTAIKIGVSALIAILGLLLTTRLARSGRALGARAIAGFALAAITLGAVLTMASQAIAIVSDHDPLPKCMFCVPLYALPAAGLLTWLVRGLAPTNLALAGASIGVAAGGIGAIAYAIYCPYDHRLVGVLSWYVIAIALCAGAGALIGPKVLRW
jgi:hypothetical protein